MKARPTRAKIPKGHQEPRLFPKRFGWKVVFAKYGSQIGSLATLPSGAWVCCMDDLSQILI